RALPGRAADHHADVRGAERALRRQVGHRDADAPETESRIRDGLITRSRDLERSPHPMSFLDRLRAGLSRTKQQIVEQFEDLVKGSDAPERRSRALDVATLDALEELLISADLGMAASAAVIAAVKAQPRDGSSLRDLVKKEIRRIFDAVDTPVVVDQHPKVVLIVGVNGTGKTTTVGKLANLLKSQGLRPLICAADTFRAAAVEQLEIWATRAGV